MILGFKQKFPWGEPTYFREKIWAGITPIVAASLSDFIPLISGEKSITDLDIKPKLHTIRLDGFDRWKPGMSIQMAYGQRTKNYQQFNKGIPELEKCVSVQKIKIWYTGYLAEAMEDGNRKQIINMHCEIDDNRFEKIELLAVNDGFSNKADFMKWFNKPYIVFTGKIIHWTDLKY